MSTNIHPNQDLLVWMDLEMSGLDPSHDRILEIATIITDYNLATVAVGPEIVIQQNDNVTERMDQWNKDHHGRSGLIDRVKSSSISESEAEERTLEFIQTHTKRNTGILAGNSIWQDRRFINRYMPSIDQYLNYRMLDVSSIKILVKNWYELPSFKKNETHRAKLDIEESIEELKFYRKTIFKDSGSVS